MGLVLSGPRPYVGGMELAVDYDNVREHQLAATLMAEVIAGARVETLPFPHMVVDGVLPELLLEGMLEDFPGDPLFDLGRETSRGRSNLDRGSIGQRRLIDRSVAWSVFAHSVHSHAFTGALMKRFAPYFGIHGCKVSADVPASLEFDVSRAAAPYKRGCHLDRRCHLLQMLFYLNDPADYAPRGGELQLYRHTRADGPVFDKFPPADELVVEATVEPRANRLVVMLNASTAYHGVAPMTSSRGYRKFVYAAVDPADGQGDLWPAAEALSESRRQAFLAE